ncbi:hypothetical protein [Henriciella mobilis]|uniref:hypothetical protein n=1 Tax=Henriciella mobilis TaxID=2305467 RepID=UPI0011C4099F|nr:hypothetical protein [Henriciella mobilis]
MVRFVRRASALVISSALLICSPASGQSFPSDPNEQQKIIGAFVEINDVWNELIPTVNELEELLPLLVSLDQGEITKSTYLSEVTRKRDKLKSNLRFAKSQVREIVNREYGESSWATRIEQYETELDGMFRQLEALFDTTNDFFISAPSLDAETEAYYSEIMVDKIRIVTQLSNLSLRGDIAMLGEEHPNVFILRSWEHQSNVFANLFELDHIFYYGSDDDVDRYFQLIDRSKAELDNFQNTKAAGLAANEEMKSEYSHLSLGATAQERELIDLVLQLNDSFSQAWSTEQDIADKYRRQLTLYETMPDPFPSDEIEKLDQKIVVLEDTRWALFDERLELAQDLVNRAAD